MLCTVAPSLERGCWRVKQANGWESIFLVMGENKPAGGTSGPLDRKAFPSSLHSLPVEDLLMALPSASRPGRGQDRSSEQTLCPIRTHGLLRSPRKGWSFQRGNLRGLGQPRERNAESNTTAGRALTAYGLPSRSQGLALQPQVSPYPISDPETDRGRGPPLARARCAPSSVLSTSLHRRNLPLKAVSSSQDKNEGPDLEVPLFLLQRLGPGTACG